MSCLVQKIAKWRKCGQNRMKMTLWTLSKDKLLVTNSVCFCQYILLLWCITLHSPFIFSGWIALFQKCPANSGQTLATSATARHSFTTRASNSCRRPTECCRSTSHNINRNNLWMSMDENDWFLEWKRKRKTDKIFKLSFLTGDGTKAKQISARARMNFILISMWSKYFPQMTKPFSWFAGFYMFRTHNYSDSQSIKWRTQRLKRDLLSWNNNKTNSNNFD